MIAFARVTAPVVYVVEDDPLASALILNLLGRHRCTTFAFESAEALLAAGPLRRPGCVLIDIGLPGIGGLELQQRLQRLCPGMPVIITTGNAEAANVRQALLAGAVDYLLKPVDADALMAAVRTACAADETRVQRQREHDELQRRLASMSAREREVFRLVTDGLHNHEIAAQLDVSVRTVEAHRASVMRKLDTERSAEWFRIRAQAESA